MKPTNCMHTECIYHHTKGIPDFPGSGYVCTVHYECELDYESFETCVKENDVGMPNVK
jgi:hypothetical protein